MRYILLAILLGGCATSNIVLEKNGQIFNCQRPSFGELRAADKCAEALERNGWKRI